MKNSLLFLLLTYFALNSLEVSAQENFKVDSLRPGEFSVPNMFKEGLRDQKIIWTKPIHIHSQDWRFLAPALVVTGIALALDHEIYNSVQGYVIKNNGIHETAAVVTNFGGGIYPIGIACIFTAGGLVFKDNKAIRTGVLSAEAIVHSSVVAVVLKAVTGRARPTAEAKDGEFGFFDEYLDEANHNSFPSGHTITAFTLATVIATQYRETIWVPVICYAAATACGISRIVLEKHWTSDVVVGAMLGYAIGRLTVKEHNKQWNLSPYVSEKGAVGIGFNTKF